MKPRLPFTGAYTALVTPFTRDGQVAYEELSRLTRSQIRAGISGLVPVGTTGESPTINFDEHKDLIRRTVEFAAGRGPVIAGTGANATAEAVELTESAKAAGADACRHWPVSRRNTPPGVTHTTVSPPLVMTTANTAPNSSADPTLLRNRMLNQPGCSHCSSGASRYGRITTAIAVRRAPASCARTCR